MVDHPSRVHLDIETDDIEAEVRRLEKLGAKKVQAIKAWWVMEAPTGQRFCVVRASSQEFDRTRFRMGVAGACCRAVFMSYISTYLT